MNQLSLGIVVLVAFTYFGGSYVPNVLKNNKQMLLGVVGGLVLGSFFGVRLMEGGEFREGTVDPLSGKDMGGLQKLLCWAKLDTRPGCENL